MRFPMNAGVWHQSGEVVDPAGIHQFNIDSFGDDR